jgi:hypothetical protein
LGGGVSGGFGKLFPAFSGPVGLPLKVSLLIFIIRISGLIQIFLLDPVRLPKYFRIITVIMMYFFLQIQGAKLHIFSSTGWFWFPLSDNL